MAKRHTTARRVSAGAALVTGLGTLGLGLATAAPAQADVTGSLEYTCEVTNEGLEQQFEDPWAVDLTVGAPEQVEKGAEIPAPDITAEVTPGEDAAAKLSSLGVKSLEGTADTAYTVGEEERSAELTIEKTDVPADGTATTVATGTGQAETAPDEDTNLPISAGNFTAELTTDTGFVMNIACTAPSENEIGTIQVGEGGGSAEEPGDGTEDPGTGEEEPGDGTEEPGAGEEEPSEGGDQPAGEEPTEEPAGEEPAGDAGQPEVPEVVQTDGGALKEERSTNAALGLGGLALIGAGAVLSARARRRQD